MPVCGLVRVSVFRGVKPICVWRVGGGRRDQASGGGAGVQHAPWRAAPPICEEPNLAAATPSSITTWPVRAAAFAIIATSLSGGGGCGNRDSRRTSGDEGTIS